MLLLLQREVFIVAVVAAVLAWAAAPVRALPEEPIVIDTGPQFLHDDHLVDNYWVPGHSRAIVERRFHRPVPYEGNPVLEGQRFSYFSVHRDEAGAFQLWYQLFDPRTLDPDAPKELPRYSIGYAESDDGLTWRIPEINRHEWRGSRTNNVVWLGIEDNGAAGGFVVRLPEEHARGYRYAMLYQTHSGLRLVGSKDGVDWDKRSDVLIKHLHSDTFNSLAYDPTAQRWFIYCRPRNIYRNWKDDNDQGAVRRVAMMSAKDLWGEWEDEPSTILVPDMIDTERGFTFFYGMPVRHYGGVFWGFLWPFQMNTAIVTELAFSRDGARWDRLETRPRLLDLGPEGAWDDGQVITTPHWVEVGDEWWIYYTGQDGPHNRPMDNTSALGLLKIRKEGFISRYGPALGGRLCTRPIVWPGGDLLVNASASGNLRVRVVDPMREPIEGFTYDDCDPMAGDSVSHPIRWGGRSLDELAGKPVRIEFELRDAHLYTFRATGRRLDESRLAELAAKLGAPSATATVDRPSSVSPSGEVAPEMERAERPDEMFGGDAAPTPGGDGIPQLDGQPLIHLDFSDADAQTASKGSLVLPLTLGQKGKEPQTTPRLVDDAAGRGALTFDGEDQTAFGRVRGALPESGVVQIAFRPDRDLDGSLTIHKYLFQLFGDSKNRDMLMVERQSGRLVYHAMRLNEQTLTLRSKEPLQADRWYEATVVFGPGGTRLYVDGELQDQWGAGYSWSSLSSPTLYVGSVPPHFGAGYSFPGAIGDLQVYSIDGNRQAETGAAAEPRAAQDGVRAAADGTSHGPVAAFEAGRLARLRLGGRELLPQGSDQPLWVLELAEPGDAHSITVRSDGKGSDQFRVSAQQPIDRPDAVAAAQWQISNPEGRRVAVVEAWASRAGSDGLDFHLAIDRLAGRHVVRQVWYPQLPLARLGERSADDYLLVPSGHGQVYRDVHAQPLGPWGRGSDVLQAIHRTRYPSKFGNLQMQFYGDTETAGGLLMTTPDPQRRIKDLVVDRDGATAPLRARFGHHPTPDTPARGRVELRYPVRLQWVEGDWYDAGRAYRAWALEQAWATSELALGRRDDLPEWFAGLPSWIRIPADPRVPFEEKTAWPLQWIEAVGGPMGVHWYGWDAEGGPWNRAFPRFVEPHDRFSARVEQYQAAGLKVMPYTNARLVDMDTPEVWSQYQDAVVRGRDGEVAARESWPWYATPEQTATARAAGKKVEPLGRSTPSEWFHVTHDFAVGWMGADRWRQNLRERHARLFLDHHVDAVYQDQLGVYPLVQYDDRQLQQEGGSPGDPLAWQRHEESLYAEIRDELRAQGVKPVLISEYLNESQMPHITGGLTVSDIGDTGREPVPLWNTVYHSHFAAIGWPDDPGLLRDPKMYLHGRMVPLVWGAQLGWITYTMPQLTGGDHPVTRAYRDAVTLRRENPTTLGWGEMLRPPVIDGVPLIEVPLSSQDGADRLPWPAILGGWFRDAVDPSRAVAVFVNWTDETRVGTAVLDTSVFRGRVAARSAEGATTSASAGGPLRLSLNLPPMSVHHFEIREVLP